MIMEAFKPLIKELISYYYRNLDNSAGGYFHIVLDDGNIEHCHILWCRDECLKYGDTFGEFLSDVLLEFTEDELSDMYDDNWWGMYN